MSLLTIGLPVYNAMPYLREAVDSLIAQTYPNFKVLAIVDESADGSTEFMRTVRDSRFDVIFQKKTGLIPTLNRMLREVDSPWLMRMDGDDIAYPTRVARTIECCEQHPDAGMFASIAEYYPPDRAVGVFRASWGTPKELRDQVKSGYLLSFCHPAATLNVQKTLSVGGYDETLEHAEDADLWWRMALNYDIHIIPEALLGYRQHGGQSTTVALKQNAVDLLYVQYRLLSRLWQLEPLSKETVRAHLSDLIPLRDLVAKSHLRDVNIHLSQGKRWRAITAVGHAMHASPTFFYKRLRDELRRNRTILNGVDPKLFLARREVLWPGQIPEPPQA